MSIENDYAFFQKAMSYGYIGKESDQTEQLKQFIAKYPTSKLRDDAMYALGNSYVKAGEDAKAIAIYNQLKNTLNEINKNNIRTFRFACNSTIISTSKNDLRSRKYFKKRKSVQIYNTTYRSN